MSASVFVFDASSWTAVGRHYNKWKERRQLKSDLADLVSDSSRAQFLHYACEPFDCIDTGSTVRVSAISIYNAYTQETECFSIHTALSNSRRKKIIQQENLTETALEEAEKSLFRAFKKYVEYHPHDTWIHWEMRDTTYGFRALESRALDIGIRLPPIPSRQKINLMARIRLVYGSGFAPHSRLLSLAGMNHIFTTDALPGKTEGGYFLEGRFYEISQSSQRKVRIMVEIARRAADGTLKTNMKWHQSPLVAAAGSIDWALENIWIRGLTLGMALWGFISLIKDALMAFL